MCCRWGARVTGTSWACAALGGVWPSEARPARPSLTGGEVEVGEQVVEAAREAARVPPARGALGNGAGQAAGAPEAVAAARRRGGRPGG